MIRKDQAYLIENIVDDDQSIDLEDDCILEAEEETIQKKDLKDIVVEVTQSNIGEFTQCDVVMPLIGHDVRMPTHQGLLQIFVDIM